MSEKPKKNLYPNQKEVWQEAKTFLLRLIKNKPAVQEAIVWGSLTDNKFGLYEKEHDGRPGSDIDLIVIIDEKYELPEEWGFKGVNKSCFDLYHLGRFYYKGNKHPIDGLIVFPSKHNLEDVRKMIANRGKSIYLKSGKSIVL